MGKKALDGFFFLTASRGKWNGSWEVLHEVVWHDSCGLAYVYGFSVVPENRDHVTRDGSQFRCDCRSLIGDKWISKVKNICIKKQNASLIYDMLMK